MKNIYSRSITENYINFTATNNQTAKKNIDKKQPTEQFSTAIKKDQTKETVSKLNLPVLATTIAGTIIPILAIRKSQIKKGELREINRKALQGLNLKTKAQTIFKSLNVKYELKEMLTVSSSSIAGGLVGGLLFDEKHKKSSKIAKIKESIFQLFNVGVPIVVGDQAVKFANKKNWKGPWVQIISPIIAIGAGMPIAAKISNTINSKIIDKENKDTRKLRIRDAFVHIDDFAGVLVLSKVPLADKLQSVLPFLYGMCGYEAGAKKSEK